MKSLLDVLSTTSSQAYWVVHPLDDRPESKRDVAALGPMPMTPSVRLSLLALRGYLILMAVLVANRFLSLAGTLSHLAR
jgi:hypothetical protein